MMSSIYLRAKASSGHACTSRDARPSRSSCVRAQALFGWGKKDDAADDAREEAFRQQQELLQKRRSGALIQEANERRRKVQETVAQKKAERKMERDMLAQGVMPESLKNWKNYKKKEDEGATSGIVVPLLPFGRVEYDEGERFDLRSPYADDGWVDPNEAEDPFYGLKKLFGFGKKPNQQSVDPEASKKIIWASDYAKYKAQQNAAKNKK